MGHFTASLTRIALHLACLCRNLQHTRFHLAGIVREIVPKGIQLHIR
ncbi:MAG: hypothetical protein ACI9R3_004166 [Verrucomicrobiales bacterium]|jgi:hypothetical protein